MSYKERIIELQSIPEESIDLKSELEELRIDPKEEIQPPEIAWVQDTKNDTRVLGTLGNFSVIIGKAKARKSFFIGVSVSAAINNDPVLGMFRGCLNREKRNVIYFDTEQGKYHVQVALNRICEQVSIEEPDNLFVYGLRTKDPETRFKLIEYAIYNTPNLGFVVIDGIKDLITSINDEEQATMVASKLLKWTEEQNIHIITVLHQNKGDNNARGHIGTELINKAETVLSVSKDEDNSHVSVVKPEMCRNMEPEPFAFEIEDNLPVIVDDYNFQLDKVTKVDALNLPNYQIMTILNEVFVHGDEFCYSDLKTQIKLASNNQLSKKLGDNSIKNLIALSKNKGYLIQEKNRGPYSLGEFKPINDDIDF